MEVQTNSIQEKVMCFTGRRPKDLYGYDKTKYEPLVDVLTNKLREFYYQGFRKFVTGGAQGFDQLSFWAINRLKTEGLDVKNVLFIPFKGQERNWLKTGLFSQEEFNLMLSLADEVVYCSENLDISKASKMEVNIAMHKRNHDMVDVSDLVFGLYPSDLWMDEYTRGGTAECLRYAKDKKKTIYQMNPFTLDCYYVA